MKLAIIGSRELTVENLEDYLPGRVSEIVSGGARRMDTSAAVYAREKGIKLTEFLPDYARYRGVAPLKRNEQLALYADEALPFGMGAHGGRFTRFLFSKSWGKGSR